MILFVISYTNEDLWRGCVPHVYGRQSSFEANVFNNFIALINTTCESINLHWITYLNIGIDHMACEFAKHHMWATSLNQIESSIFVYEGDI
jgi:hypothetical protein